MAGDIERVSPSPEATPGIASAVLASLLSQPLDAVVVTDVEFNVTEYAGSAERLYGWSRADVLGRH